MRVVMVRVRRRDLAQDVTRPIIAGGGVADRGSEEDERGEELRSHGCNLASRSRSVSERGGGVVLVARRAVEVVARVVRLDRTSCFDGCERPSEMPCRREKRREGPAEGIESRSRAAETAGSEVGLRFDRLPRADQKLAIEAIHVLRSPEHGSDRIRRSTRPSSEVSRHAQIFARIRSWMALSSSLLCA